MSRRRFRMNKPLFLRIVDTLSNQIPYFQQRRDATGRLGLSGLQKCTTAIRMMAYGCAADAVDEYLCLGESTALLCLEKYVDGIIIFLSGDLPKKAYTRGSPTIAQSRRSTRISRDDRKH